MVLNWQKVEGSQAEKPLEIDKTSSGVYVYLRRNIKSTTKDDGIGGTVEMWEYEEVKLTKIEYQWYLIEKEIKKAEQQRADIDYIALMTGVDLEETEVLDEQEP